MEDNEKIDPQYVRRFNEGYTIAKYMPDLAEQLYKIKGATKGLEAMNDGRSQYLSEQTREKLPSWLRKDPSKISNRLFSKDRGRSNEPDR